jgi:hypothetical protein
MQSCSASVRFAFYASVLCILGDCAADTHVYRSRGDAADSSAVTTAGRAGSAPAPGMVCAAAAKLLSEADTDESEPRPCDSDEDCSRALFAPACNRASGLCVPCPRPDQIATGSVRAGLCIGANAARCCRSQDSIADCLIQACMSPCDNN